MILNPTQSVHNVISISVGLLQTSINIAIDSIRDILLPLIEIISSNTTASHMYSYRVSHI